MKVGVESVIYKYNENKMSGVVVMLDMPFASPVDEAQGASSLQVNLKPEGAETPEKAILRAKQLILQDTQVWPSLLQEDAV